MTSIVHFSTAEWNRRLAERGGRNKDGLLHQTAEIIIFPGVRVEYSHDIDDTANNAEGSVEAHGRLKLGPLVQRSID